MTYRHSHKRWQPSGTYSECHAGSACPTYNNASHYNKSGARSYTALPMIGARYEARRGSKNGYANCPSDRTASYAPRPLQKPPQEACAAIEEKLSSSSSDTNASTDTAAEEFVAGQVATKGKWSAVGEARADANVTAAPPSETGAIGMLATTNKTSWAVWDRDDAREGEKEAAHKDKSSWAAWNWDDSYEGEDKEAHKNKAAWDWGEADDSDGKLAVWEEPMVAKNSWERTDKMEGCANASERPWSDVEWPRLAGKGGRRASAPGGGRFLRAKSAPQNEESAKKSTGTHYPRFATYLRVSNIKNTFVHFYEKMYNTRKSIDDASILYQTYTQELVTPQNIEKSFSRRDKDDEGPETLMICNIPCRFTQPEVMSMMDSKGFGDQYNFFYLPMDGKRSSKPQAVKKWSNLGYAFVNFKCPKDAARFERAFNGFCFVGYDGTLSKKVCRVAPARMQGFYENLRCYQRRISGEEAARNSPFISVPLEKFNMNASEFIDWIFSPTDVAQFLPASTESSWEGDLISCDQIQAHNISEDEQCAGFPKIMPLVPERNGFAYQDVYRRGNTQDDHNHYVDDAPDGENYCVENHDGKNHGVDNHGDKKHSVDNHDDINHSVDNHDDKNDRVDNNKGQNHSVDNFDEQNHGVDNHDEQNQCVINHDGQNHGVDKHDEQNHGVDKHDEQNHGVDKRDDEKHRVDNILAARPYPNPGRGSAQGGT